MDDPSATIHASAVLIGARAVLVRGASGSGKSHFVLALLQSPQISFARLVADDRAHVTAAHGRLIVRPADALKGMIEARGLGILRLPYEPSAIVGCVVDLDASDARRLPQEGECETAISGVRLARLAVAPGSDALVLFMNFLARQRAGKPSSP